MGGRGARSELYDIMHDQPYGTEYTCIAKYGRYKILRFRDGKQSKAPMETRTRGRVYAVIDEKGDIVCIVFYDKKNKRVRQIDLRHSHRIDGVPIRPHVHVGYINDEHGTRRPTPEEHKLMTQILTYWEKKRDK